MMRDISETEAQIAVVEWCAWHKIKAVHIPNEGKRSQRAGAELKRMGMQTGFPDLFIPVPKGNYHGLFIELKVGKNRPTRAQQQWLSDLSVAGYAVCLCYGSTQAIQKIERYMEL